MEYSAAFRKRMVERMMGPRAMSAMTLSAEVGVGQPTLSRWLRDASILARVFGMKDKDPKPLSMWTSKEKLHAIVEPARFSADYAVSMRRVGCGVEARQSVSGCRATSGSVGKDALGAGE